MTWLPTLRCTKISPGDRPSTWLACAARAGGGRGARERCGSGRLLQRCNARAQCQARCRRPRAGRCRPARRYSSTNEWPGASPARASRSSRSTGIRGSATRPASAGAGERAGRGGASAAARCWAAGRRAGAGEVAPLPSGPPHLEEVGVLAAHARRPRPAMRSSGANRIERRFIRRCCCAPAAGQRRAGMLERRARLQRLQARPARAARCRRGRGRGCSPRQHAAPGAPARAPVLHQQPVKVIGLAVVNRPADGAVAVGRHLAAWEVAADCRCEASGGPRAVGGCDLCWRLARGCPGTLLRLAPAAGAL
jgi:hypothetical protein